MPLYYLSNYRTEEQLADMLRLEAAGVCVFCPENLTRDPAQEILHRNAHWSVTPNEFPYRGTKLHLLLVPHRHVADLVELDAEAFAALRDALAWIRREHGLSHYGLGARNGDGLLTGATIEHVHLHVIVGDPDDPAHEPVRMKLSARPDRAAELRLRRRIPEVHPDQLHPGGA